MKFKDLLNRLDACNSATKWASDNPIERVVQTCHRGDWLLWIAKKIDLPLQELTLAKALCAKTVIHLIKDERSINAVNVAERFGRGLATRNELDTAAAAAASAAAAAADAAAAAAYAAADASAAAAAAYAAADAAYAAADAADAAYAAADASAAAYAAYAAADAASAAADAYARTKSQLETANICREILGQLIINRVNELCQTI